MQKEGYYDETFFRPGNTDELVTEENPQSWETIDLDFISLPKMKYNDIHYDVTYEELTIGF